MSKSRLKFISIKPQFSTSLCVWKNFFRFCDIQLFWRMQLIAAADWKLCHSIVSWLTWTLTFHRNWQTHPITSSLCMIFALFATQTSRICGWGKSRFACDLKNMFQLMWSFCEIKFNWKPPSPAKYFIERLSIFLRLPPRQMQFIVWHCSDEHGKLSMQLVSQLDIS